MMVAVRYGSIGCLTDVRASVDREVTASRAAERLRQALQNDREWFSREFIVRFSDGELVSLRTHSCGWVIEGDSEITTFAFLEKTED